jgi:hypothetical protein
VIAGLSYKVPDHTLILGPAEINWLTANVDENRNRVEYNIDKKSSDILK